MINDTQAEEYYHALVDRNTEYEGIFFVGVTSTGIFCRPSCPARKPKRENCLFFHTAQQALLAGFRPCQRCHPLEPPHEASEVIRRLIAAVEAEPEKRWRDRDFRALGVDESTARRQFKKRYGMTFVAYARARRMGMALKQIRQGESVIDTQLASGYESGSGFRDAFSKIMGTAPSSSREVLVLKASWIDTPLGPMVAMADDEGLYLLEFVDRRGLEREVERMRKRLNAAIVPGDSPILRSIERELIRYFAGKLTVFETPIITHGSPFQERVWEELRRIPAGQTRSYGELAKLVGNPKGARAVARANASNQLAIIIPCHRVINATGEIGGYGGGVPRKEWMLELERGNK